MLVGRQSEQRLLDALVAGARVGRSGVLVLTGEAGIGKTALLRYAVDAAGDMPVLSATGTEAERDVPFGGLAQLLRPSPDDLATLAPPQAQAIGVALALRVGPVPDRLAVGAGVLSLLTRYSEVRPLGVVVDDAHLLDAPSAEALAFACRRFLADSLFVVAAVRSGEPTVLASSGLPELPVEGLDASATAHLAAQARTQAGQLANAPLDGAALRRLTGGNPLAVLSLACEPGDPGRLASGLAVPVPTALREWFGRRAAALSDDARTVLLLAAVEGGDPAVVARAVAAVDADLASIAEAERAGLVRVTAERIEFVHPLARSAVYALAFPDQRRAAHVAVAAALPPHDADRRAFHRGEATVGADESVAQDLEAAGHRAVARAAHAVGATAFRRAARLSADDVDRRRRLLVAGEAAWSGGDGVLASALLEEVNSLTPSVAERARCLALQGDIAARGGDPRQARELFLAAAHDVVGLDRSQAVLFLADAVLAGFYTGDAAAAVTTAGEIDALLAEPLRPAAAAVGNLASGMAAALAGRSGTDRIRAGTRLLDAVTTTDPGAVRPAWLMFGPLWLRDSGSARSLVRTALAEGRARSAVSSLPTLLFTLARDGATTEHWTSAEADYGEAIALAGELGHTTDRAMSLAGLAWLEARQGRADACRGHAEQALSLCADHPVNVARVWALFALAELALAMADPVAAVAGFRDLMAFLVEIDLRDPDVSPAPELAEALLMTGRREDAQALILDFDVAATTKGLPWSRARAMRVRGLLAPAQDLDSCFHEALSLHAATPDVFETARTSLCYGARLRRSRRRADARRPLREALATFSMLGAHPWAATCAAELTASGENVPRLDSAARQRLTPRELQIAISLSEGRTTRETAAALFLSPKTVEYHLRHVYTKLGISSRKELRAHLAKEI